MSTLEDEKVNVIERLMSRSIAERTKDFSSLLDEIESLNVKKKQLWSEIYENAIVDRQHAFTLFSELCSIVNGKSTEYAVHGKNLVLFLERMGKANEQLIRLVELIARAETKNSGINPDDLFEKISGSNN